MIQQSRLGHKILIPAGGERVEALVPPPLPPNPPIMMDGLYSLLEGANRALGQLDGMCRLLPDKMLFLYAYVRKEALLSCQIEGTQSSLSDLFLSEHGAARSISANGIREVTNYVDAMEYGLERVRDADFPVSQRLMREIHERLLSGGRGGTAQPGEYRRSQNWIGGTRPGNAVHVPPPHHMVPDLMTDLEKFIHTTTPDTPDLVKAGLVHVQFETIHPFLDGNGRLGRLLITFLLCAQDILQEPLLYLSLYLKAHRARYYELLQMVREEGVWEDWLAFFLEGVQYTAKQAVDSAGQILDLFERDRRRIETIGRAAQSALRVHEFMQRNPIFSITEAVEKLPLSRPTIRAAILVLEQHGMVAADESARRPRHFVYNDYLEILQQGTDPL